MIGSLSKSPAAVSITAITSVVIIEVDTAVFMRTYSFAPKSCDITTAQPAFMPFAICMKSIVTGYDAPTAARASSPSAGVVPIKFPAMTLSQILYICWKIILISIGKVNRQISEDGLPLVRSVTKSKDFLSYNTKFIIVF